VQAELLVLGGQEPIDLVHPASWVDLLDLELEQQSFAWELD